MELRLEAIAALVAFGITAAFLIHPGPYWMALFAFLAQPLFLIAGVLYLGRVVQDLRRRRIF